MDFFAGFKIGADSSQFERGMANAAASASKAGERIGKAFDAKNLGATLATAIGLNLTSMAEKIVAPFREAAELADSLAGHSERAAAAQERMLMARLNDAQQLEKMEGSLKRMQDQLKDMTERPVKSDSFLGFIQRGSALDKLFGFSRREDNKSRDAVGALEADIAEAQEKLAAKKVATDKKVSTEKKKSDDEEVERAKRYYAERDKVAEIDKEIAEFNRNKGTELEELKRRELGLSDEINRAQSFAREGGELTSETKEKLLEQLKEQKKVTEEIAKLEGDIAKKNDDTLKLKVSITRVGRTDEALSDRELAAKEKNLRQQALQASLNIGGVYTGASTNDILGGIRNQELWRVNDEQNRRSRVRGLARAFGEDRAFEMSGLSEQHFRDIISGATESQQLARRTALGIEQLNNLLKSGIPVVNLNK